MRQFDVYIDGTRLPAWLLRDAETQLRVRSAFHFDDSVVRDDAVANLAGDFDEDDEFAGPIREHQVMEHQAAGLSDTDSDAPPIPPFAHLDGHALSFMLVRSEFDSCGRAVRVGSGDEDLRLQEQGRERVFHFGPAQWPWLEWSTPYVVYEAGDRAVRMTLEVRRAPLGDMGAALNRMERL